MENHFQAIVLDFDYTVADSSSVAADCINFALQELGLPTVSTDVACQTIGLSLSDTFLKLVEPHHATQADEFARLFMNRADEVGTDRIVLFESVPRTVRLLKSCDIALGIVSTKYRCRIEAILRREKLLSSFDIIIGGEDVSAHKPDPEGLLTAMARLKSPPSSCLYVGDSVTDAETARRAAVPFAAVLSGATARGDFRGYDVYGILEGLSQLPELIGC